MNKQISANIKILGFLMTCFMVIYHSPLLDNSYALGPLDAMTNPLIIHISNILGTLAMSHFFAVTGYLLFQNYSLKEYPQKIKRRVFSLLIPYLLWQSLTTIVDMLQNQYVFSLSDFLRRTFLLVRWPQDGALWYVYAVFLMALISPIILPILRNKKVGWSVILVLIVFFELSKHISIPIFVKLINYGYLSNILYYLPSYLVGCFYGKFSDEKTGAESLKYALSALLVALLLNGVLPGFFEELAIKMLPIMILYLLPLLNHLKNRRIYALTFLIYAIHQPLINDIWPLLNGIYLKLSIPALLCNILTKFIVLGMCIGIAALLHKLLHGICPKILGAFTGGRF